jgi:hypothetical protein
MNMMLSEMAYHASAHVASELARQAAPAGRPTMVPYPPVGLSAQFQTNLFTRILVLKI